MATRRGRPLRLEAVELMTPGGEVQEGDDETAEEARPVTRSCCGRPSCRLLAPPVREAVWMVSTSLQPAVADGTVWRMTRGGEWLESPLARTVVRGSV